MRSAREQSAVDILVAAEMVAWSLSLPVLKRVVPLPRLVALLWTAGRPDRWDERKVRIVTLSARVSRVRPRGRSNCLERSLLAYRFLARAGGDPRLVLAVGSRENGVVGHAWVALDGEPVHESREAVADFAPIVEFGPHGRATHVRGEQIDLPSVWL